MRIKFVTICLLAMGLVTANEARAAFVLSVDPETLIFGGPGEHTVNMMITHSGVGPSTLSGYTIRFGSAENASLGVMPEGVRSLSAINSIQIGDPTTGFSLNPVTNTVAAASLFTPDVEIGSGQTRTLFALTLDLGSASSYEIGVDFQNANRGTLFTFQDATAEFFDPNSPMTDFSFTVTAVPEPSSLALLACFGGFGAYRIRRRLFAADAERDALAC